MPFQMLVEDPISYFRLIVITGLSICLHELAHGVAALSQGDDTPRRTGHMTLNPLVHMGWGSIIFLLISGISWGAMPVNPNKFRSRQWGDVLVAAAGPLANLILGMVCIGFLAIAMRGQFLSIEFFQLAAQKNLVLCMFNLLPIPPLDGFHVSSKFFPELRSMENSHFSLFALMIFLVLGIDSSLAIVSKFIIRILV